jgi:hypothetical protein
MPEPEYLKIQLTRGQVALVDAEDYERISTFSWWANYDPTTGTFYAKTQIKRGPKDWTAISMHRMVMGLESGDPRQVDHRDRNTLDNRRSNLRVSTASENACNRGRSTRNTSGFKGVVWNKARGRWLAQIRVNGKLIFLGRSHDINEAAAMYAAGSRKYHGEFGSIE